MSRRVFSIAAALALLLIASSLDSVQAAQSAGEVKSSRSGQHDSDWPVYGGQDAGNHYSPLTQINRRNVKNLHVAWTFDTHETGGFQTSPLVVGRVLYGYSPSEKVIAVDAGTGKLLWTFDSGVAGTQPDRGLSFYREGKEQRLFAGVMNFLYALDPATGKPIPTFGENGRIDLRKELRGDYLQNSVILTSPGVIYKDLIIVGGRNPETHPAPPGDVRAFDVHTGKLRWSFHTIPHPGEPGYETWPPEAWKTAGAANNWAGMTLDAARGIVYVPTGSAVFDFFGGDRIGDDLYANSLLALDAATGHRIWHFQAVHHDVWDRDFPSTPTLLTVTHDKKRVDAVAQTSKQGFVYLFDRVTGKPLFPLEERAYPASDLPGEITAKTQSLPTRPAPFGRQVLTQDMLTNRSPEAHKFALESFKTFRSNGQFLPFTLDKLTVVFPGFDGGAEWGGPAVDPSTGVIYVNSNEMAWIAALVKTKSGGTPGEIAYRNLCSVCHGVNREGAPPAFPTLIGIDKRLSNPEIITAIHQGKGRMPGFTMIDDAAMQSLLELLKSAPAKQSNSGNPIGEKKELASLPAVNKQVAADNPAGAASYQKRCAICHGDNREGISPSFPALLGVGARMTVDQSVAIIQHGKGRMPGFATIQTPEMDALLKYLGVTPGAPADPATVTAGGEMRYQFSGYRKFLDQEGYPAISPPWGTLNAINLNTGEYLWKIPFGEYPELAAMGMKNTGSENYGGPIVTAGGLLFISATVYDKKMHAFNSQTGQLLWESTMPYSGLATPVTYMVDGKQYVVIAAGGGKDPKSPSGGQYIAFALP